MPGWLILGRHPPDGHVDVLVLVKDCAVGLNGPTAHKYTPQSTPTGTWLVQRQEDRVERETGLAFRHICSVVSAVTRKVRLESVPSNRVGPVLREDLRMQVVFRFSTRK